MGKVYGYCRLALANEEEMAEQLYQVDNYCKAHGLELHQRFYDNGVSGLTLDRDGLKSMLDVLQEGDIVVVRDIARLSRNMQQCLEITELISEAGATLIVMDLEKEKKIINLSPAKEDYGCIICCNGHATTKVEILRLVNLKNDSLISFNVCDDCLAQMQGDIQKICE